jgi:hypothetical protein
MPTPMMVIRLETPENPGLPLGSVEIVNDNTGTAVLGNYQIQLLDQAGAEIERAQLKHFPRKLGPWELATQALLRLMNHHLGEEWEASDSGM